MLLLGNLAKQNVAADGICWWCHQFQEGSRWTWSSGMPSFLHASQNAHLFPFCMSRHDFLPHALQCTSLNNSTSPHFHVRNHLGIKDTLFTETDVDQPANCKGIGEKCMPSSTCLCGLHTGLVFFAWSVIMNDQPGSLILPAEHNFAFYMDTCHCWVLSSNIHPVAHISTSL